MATPIKVDPKKTPVKQVDRRPRDGISGMSHNTKLHFVNVQNKMLHYVNQQEGYEFDQRPNPLQARHHQQLNHVMVDEKKAPKTRPQTSTPTALRKPAQHLAVPISHSDHGHRKSSPKPRVE